MTKKAKQVNEVALRIASGRATMLGLITDAGKRGMTMWQLMDASGMKTDSAHKRCSELADLGLIGYIRGATEDAANGCVWVLAEYHQAHLIRAERMECERQQRLAKKDIEDERRRLLRIAQMNDEAAAEEWAADRNIIRRRPGEYDPVKLAPGMVTSIFALAGSMQ